LKIRLRPDAGIALCIDIGQRHVDVAFGDLSGVTVSSDPEEIDVAGDAPGALAEAVALVQGLLSKQTPPVRPADLVGVCVGIPAPIDHHRGQLGSTLGLPTWAGIRPAQELRRRLGPEWDDTPFMLENDANLRALAELTLGAARAHADDNDHVALSVKWSEGIGGAIIKGNELITGWRGIAGEFGHTVLPNPDPSVEDCIRCGHKCLEAHAGGRALVKRIEDEGGSLFFSELVRRAVAKDGRERTLIQQAATRIGQALGYHISSLNPRLVIIGGRPFGSLGEDVEAYGLIADFIRGGWRETGFPPSIEDVDLALAARRDLAAVEGGIIAVLRAGLPSHLERRLALS
jgi:predicted NBD/HSP70 family sugar kinase